MTRVDTTAPVASLQVLGPLALRTADGSHADLPVGKPFAALLYIALEPGSVRRCDLATLLWGDADEERARHSVRQALSLIRKACGSECLDEAGDQLRLSAAVCVDFDEFVAAVDEGRLEAAWALWGDGLLPSFELPDVSAFNAWCEDTRSKWSRRLASLMLARNSTEVDASTRVPWLERAVRLVPHDEDVHRALVQTLLDLRSATRARAALDTARAALSPDQIEWLGEAIHRLERLEEAACEQSSADGPPALRFVGRGDVFARLCRSWRDVLDGAPRVAMVVGARGIGKTRLLDETATWCVEQGGTLVHVRGVSSQLQLELGVVASIVRALLELPGAAGISAGSQHTLEALLPSTITSGPARRRTPTPIAIADALGDLVHAVAAEIPIVLVVDNGERIDSSSRRILSDLLPRLQPGSMFFGIYARRIEGQDLAQAPVPRQAGTLVVIDLEPLHADDVDALVRHRVQRSQPDPGDGASPSPGQIELIARALHRTTGGVPRLIERVLADLEQQAGWPRLDPSGRMKATWSTDRLVQWICRAADHPRTVAQLSPQALAVARRIAAQAEPQRPSQVRRLMRITSQEFAAAVRELDRLGLVLWRADRTLSMASESGRDAIQRSLRPTWSVGIRADTKAPAGSRHARRLRTVALIAVVAAALVLVWSGRINVRVQRIEAEPQSVGSGETLPP